MGLVTNSEIASVYRIGAGLVDSAYLGLGSCIYGVARAFWGNVLYSNVFAIFINGNRRFTFGKISTSEYIGGATIVFWVAMGGDLVFTRG